MELLTILPMSDLKLTQYWSPSFDIRPKHFAVDMLVLHYTGMRDADTALEKLCDPKSKVSSHYLIDEEGTICQLVQEAHRAWHAGESRWGGEEDINSLSIGIELVNPGHELNYTMFPEIQMLALENLIFDVQNRHLIPNHRVLGHSDVAPYRKRDPGELFDWQRLASKGIGLWPTTKTTTGTTMTELRLGAESAQVTDMQQSLALFGYQIEDTGIYDTNTEKVVIAFQRHFRPNQIDGIFDQVCADRLLDLINQIE